MKKIFAIALVAAAALSAAPASAQGPDEAYIEKAWADGVLSSQEKAEIDRIADRSQRALAAKVATMKLSPNGRAYSGTLGYVDQQANPWKPTAAAAVAVDYNGDRQPDQARIHTNGKQTAVIVTIGGKPTVVYKADGNLQGAKLYAAGTRLLLSLPDTSPIVLFQSGGKPAVAFLGD